MTFESIRDVLFVQEGMKELKIKLNFLIFKHVVKRSHSEACSLKKMYTTLHLFCFHMSYFIFWNQKRAVRKKN